MRILILMDNATLAQLVSGQPPIAGFSHDKNLFQFAHESLRKGYELFICSIQDDKRTTQYNRIYSVYPFWDARPDGTDYGTVCPDIVVGVFLEAMNVRTVFPHAKIVAIQAAIHWSESPETFGAEYLFDTITAIRYNVDFLITQNERMKNLLDVFFKFVAKTSIADRIIVAPLGIVEEERREVVDRQQIRRQMGLADGEIAIVNSGGVWSWTDFNCFISAFCRHCDARASKLKIFIMGFQQPENDFHTAYIAQTKKIISQHSHLIGRNIVIEDEWYRASKVVKQYTAAADVGLNVNLPTLENWQSYRLRFLDYLYFGIPAINTAGDQVADEVCPEALFVVKPGNEQSYLNVLSTIESDPKALATRAAAMHKLARSYDSRATYGVAIDHIVASPRRPEQDFAAWPETVLDFATRRAGSMFKGRLAARLGEWLDD
ncbi:hypothetical protein [Sphingobium fluviale]|uniref:hypothetical protein n=1 Tax=Sphingobium fluviale TaxID=2506423 RepID=UPI0013E96D74|nr:hypothetical protein [Sphingobium fluviale]